jgi:hypothetical protein
VYKLRALGLRVQSLAVNYRIASVKKDRVVVRVARAVLAAVHYVAAKPVAHIDLVVPF